MAFVQTAYINNGTFIAQANKVNASPRLNASYDGTSIVTFDLNTIGSVGTYNNVITDAYGRITSGSLISYLTSNQTITVTGDVSGSGTTSIALTLASVMSAGTYAKVVVNAKGLVIASASLSNADITTALGFTPISTASEGVANGVATLDSTGHLTSAQIPTSLVGGLVYQGTWNASTNSPALTSGTGTNGWFYKVATAGTTTLDGISVWNVGDTAVFEIPSGSTLGTWGKIDGITNEVISVAGMTGAVTLSVSNITGAAPLASPAFTGTPTAPTPTSTDNSSLIATTSFVKEQGYITSNQTITVSGDASGSGSTAITLTLAAVGTAGVYTAVTTDSKGRVISGANLTVSGDVTGTASGTSIALALAASGVTAGTYNNVVVNSKGLVTSASNNSYLLTTGGTLTGALIGTTASFSGALYATTAGYATNTTQVATTAFVQQSAGNYTATINYSAATGTLIATQSGSMIEITGTITSGASVVSAVGNSGRMFTFYNNSSNVFTATSLGGLFSGPVGSGASAISLSVGAVVQIISDGTNWVAVDSAYAGNIGPWLSLAGGTLSGALIGTTASFSGGVSTGSLVATVINNTPIGVTTPSTGKFTNLTASTGSFTSVTINGAAAITSNQSITISGDASGTGTTAITLTLASVMSAGTYSTVVVDSKGRVVSGSGISSVWTRATATTGTFSVTSTISYVGVNYAGNVSVTLQTGSVEGRVLYIKDESGNAYTNNITVYSTAPDLIDGGSYVILNVNYEGAHLIYSGNSWRQM